MGWASEHCTAAFAAQVRAERMRELRHGNTPVIPKKNITFAAAWAIFDEQWLCRVKSAQDDRFRYDKHLKERFGGLPLSAITTASF